MGGAGASASSSAAADGKNAVNARNAASLASAKSDIAKFDAEIAQWGAVISKYALPASEQPPSPGEPGDGRAAPPSARKRALAAGGGAPAAAAAAAAGPGSSAALAAASLAGLDPYDIIDDGEDVDEATLAKYGLASSLSVAVASGLDELVTSVSPRRRRVRSGKGVVGSAARTPSAHARAACRLSIRARACRPT